jgi:hypothetical protein
MLSPKQVLQRLISSFILVVKELMKSIKIMRKIGHFLLVAKDAPLVLLIFNDIIVLWL